MNVTILTYSYNTAHNLLIDPYECGVWKMNIFSVLPVRYLGIENENHLRQNESVKKVMYKLKCLASIFRLCSYEDSYANGVG